MQAAGLGVEVEKPGLLPLRPDGDGAEDGGRGAGHRRPADAWVAQWGLHGAAALDLAVTSGLRTGAVLSESARSGVAAAEAYEARKRTHLQTEQHCKAEGLQFIPLVAETAASTWRQLAGLIAARSGDNPGVEADRLLQSLSVVLQRENARAVLRRLSPGAGEARPFTDP